MSTKHHTKRFHTHRSPRYTSLWSPDVLDQTSRTAMKICYYYTRSLPLCGSPLWFISNRISRGYIGPPHRRLTRYDQ